MSSLHSVKSWAKNDPSTFAHFIRELHKSRRSIEMPSILSFIYRPLKHFDRHARSVMSEIIRVFYWTPIFKTYLTTSASRLYLFGGMPLVLGPLKITCGTDCRISGQTTFSGRWSGATSAELIIGNNVGIGWQTTIAVGQKIKLGDNVRIAGRSFIAGYPGHPINAKDRAAGLPDLDEQIGDVILERDVWLGTGVAIMPGVTIGAETIVAAGSIVTKSLPAGVLAGGNPARVIKHLKSEKLEAIQ